MKNLKIKKALVGLICLTIVATMTAGAFYAGQLYELNSGSVSKEESKPTKLTTADIEDDINKALPSKKTASSQSLALASDFFFLMNESQQLNFVKDMLNLSEGDLQKSSEAINVYAKQLDADPAQKAMVTAMLKKNAQANQQPSYESDSIEYQPSTVNQNSNSDCQQRMAKYNSCLSEYQIKIQEYNQCLSEKENLQFYKFCAKPYYSCSKPYC